MENNARHTVIDYSVIVEDRLSMVISSLLGIEDYINSKSFGVKTTALSFNQKLNILFDLGVLDNKQKLILEHFSQIRNQFAHNLSVTSFEACFNNIKGLENFFDNTLSKVQRESMQKLFGSKEKKTEFIFKAIVIGVFAILDTLYDKVYKKRFDEGYAKGIVESQEKMLQAYMESIKFVTDKVENGELIGKAIVVRVLETMREESTENKPL